jgi:hypothetical protein
VSAAGDKQSWTTGEETTMAAVKASEQRTIDRAKRTPSEQRDLLDTLLAADIPFDRAVSLIADERMQTGRGVRAEYADLFRTGWAPRHPEGSEARLQLEAVANALDPEAEL